jgi:hypothetical protein
MIVGNGPRSQRNQIHARTLATMPAVSTTSRITPRTLSPAQPFSVARQGVELPITCNSGRSIEVAGYPATAAHRLTRL